MRFPILPKTLSIVFVVLCSPATADGFRPDSDLATSFVNEIAVAEIAVFPTIIRTPYISRYSTASQKLAIESLQKDGLGTARLEDVQFYLGDPIGQSQFAIFQNAMQKIGAQLEEYDDRVDYIIVIEVVFPPSRDGGAQVFGIHVYVLDSSGRNAFSFLLNSHYKSFSDARLRTSKDTAKSREHLAIKSTKVAMNALKEQIGEFRECIARSGKMAPVVIQAGVLLDFEPGLPTGTDGDGIPIGFSTFGDDKSSARISTTFSHPARPGEAAGNKVLQLDLDVTVWGGVLHRIENETLNRWVTHDWSTADGFGLWLYGNNTGTQLYFDVLDNRKSCSTIDDAERYRYVFYDDVAGWRLITVPFKDLGRKDVGNGAPDDGLGLVNVHGWGLGTLNTAGRKTYYIDDLQLWTASSDVTAAGGETISHGLFDEVRLNDTSSRIVINPDRSGQRVVDKALELMCKCARLTADRGFSYFKMDERAHLADGRGTVLITFFRSPPEGMPVVDIWPQGAPENFTNPMTSLIDAEEYVKACNLLRGQLNQP